MFQRLSELCASALRRLAHGNIIPRGDAEFAETQGVE